MWAVLSAVKSLIILLASVLSIVVFRALHIAARKGDFSMVIQLLRLGADPLLVNSSHHFPSKDTPQVAEKGTVCGWTC